MSRYKKKISIIIKNLKIIKITKIIISHKQNQSIKIKFQKSKNKFKI